MGIMLFRLLIYLPLIRFAARVGMQHGLAWSHACAALQMFGLFASQYSTVWLFVSVVFWAAGDALYWSTMHVDLANLASKKNMSKNIGGFFIVSTLADSIAPVMGGLIAAFVEPSFIFLTSLTLLVLAIFVLRAELSGEGRPSVSVGIYAPTRSMYRPMLASWADNMSTTMSINAWPLLIYLTIGGFDTLGYIIGVGLAVSTIAIWFVSRMIDAHSSLFVLGMITRVLTFPLRAVASGLSALVGANIFNAVTSMSLYAVPYSSSYHRRAKKQPVHFVYWAELSGTFGIFCAWAVVFGLALIVSQQETALRYALIAGGLISPLAWLMRTPPKE